MCMSNLILQVTTYYVVTVVKSALGFMFTFLSTIIACVPEWYFASLTLKTWLLFSPPQLQLDHPVKTEILNDVRNNLRLS